MIISAMYQNPLQDSLEERIKLLGPNSVINLIDSNFLDNGFIFPPEILRAGLEKWLAQRNYHPDPKGDVAARQAIANFYRNGGPISRPFVRIHQSLSTSERYDADKILLTASSSESYNLLFQTFCQPGDNILVPNPGYPLFEDLASANHLETLSYPLDEGRDWQPNLDVMEALINPKTRFVVLISPNNPCGSYLSRELVQEIINICAIHQVMIISDEVFSEFLYHDAMLPRAADFADPVPVFTINGISKLFALPDLKLSWIVVTGPTAPSAKFLTQSEIIRTLEIRNDNFLSCNSFSQYILPALFSTAQEFVQEMVMKLQGNRDLLVRHIASGLPPGVRIIPPQAGIHCIIGLSTYVFPDDETLAIKLISEHGLYLHPGYLYGIEDGPALVMSLLKSPEVFSRGCAKLFQALSI